MSSFSIAGSSDTSKDNESHGRGQASVHFVSGVFRATEDHTPKQEGEMSLIKGDFITEVRPLGHSWAIGRNYRGFIGTFPLHSVVPVSDASAVLPLRLTTDAAPDLSKTANNNIEPVNNNIKQDEQMTNSYSADSNEPQNTRNSFTCALQDSSNHCQACHPPHFHPQVQQRHDKELVDATNQTGEVPSHHRSAGFNKLFSKPSMLVKPRPGKTNKFFLHSKTCGHSSSYNKSPRMSEQEKSKHNFTFPSSNKLIKSKKVLSADIPDPYYSTPASSCNFSCHCSRSGDEKEIVKIPKQGVHYENITSGQHCTTVRTPNENVVVLTNPVTPPLPNRRYVYSKVNKSRTVEREQILNNDIPRNADPILYTEPTQERCSLIPPLPQDRLRLPSSLPPTPPAHKNGISLARIVCSFLGAILMGGSVFALMIFILEYNFMYGIIVASVTFLMLWIMFLASRLVRCIFALLMPTLSTRTGRTFVLIVIWSTIIWGPIQDVNKNLIVTLNSTSCLLEQTFNQTNLLMQPYDAIMEQVNRTLVQLEKAAHDVNFGLLPLDQGLEYVEMELRNGHIKLLGTKKTCQVQLTRAFNSCSSGLANAHVQCTQAMTALGTVYQNAKQAIDYINPGKWNVPSQRVARENQRTTGAPTNGHDPCEPLKEASACHNLSDSSDICKPAMWAGEAIQEAVNFTQAAMKKLHKALQFHITAQPYLRARQAAMEASTKLRSNIISSYTEKLKYFDLAILIFLRLTPSFSLLLIISAYVYVQRFVTDIKFDNKYVDKELDVVDHLRNGSSRENRLLPLRKHEKSYLKRGLSNSLHRGTTGDRWDGFLTVVINLSISMIIYTVSYRFYLFLSSLKVEAAKARDLDGSESLELVVTGEGMIVELLDIFLGGLHPRELYRGNVTNAAKCLTPPHATSLITAAFICSLYFIMLVCLIFKTQILSLRAKIAGYFYVKQKQSRLIWLYDHMTFRRSRYPGILFNEVMSNYRVTSSYEKVSIVHSCFHKASTTCKQQRKCLLCGSNESYLSRRCTTENCIGTYCLTCLNDMAETCPLCWAKSDHEEGTNK